MQEDYQFLNEDWLDEERIGFEQYYNEDEDEYYDDEYERDSGLRADYIAEKLAEKGIQCGGVGYDGGGKEFVTYPDSVTLIKKGGSKRLKDLVEVLKQNTKADKASGTHIHISKLPTDTKRTWDNIYWFCMCFGPQLQKIFGRRSHWAPIALPTNYFSSSSDVNQKLFQAPQKRPVPDRTPYANKHAMVNDRGNRYEFRGPKSSHDIDEILAWAELCNNIVNLCANGYIKDMSFSEVLRGKYIRAYTTKIGEQNPLRKLSSAERASKISELGYVVIDTSATRFEGGECALFA